MGRDARPGAVGAGAATWAIRIGFILLFAGSTWLLARLTSRYYGARAGFLAAFALNVTGYYGLAASTFALPDGPLLFFWLLTIDRLSVAVDDPSRTAQALDLGRAGLGRCDAQQVSRRVHPAGNRALRLARSPDAALARSRRAVSGVRARACCCSVRSSSGTPAMAGCRFCSREGARSGARCCGPITSRWRSWPRRRICSRGSGCRWS